LSAWNWPTRAELDAVIAGDRVDAIRHAAYGVAYDGLGTLFRKVE
jgi:hypothetical protein